MKKIYLSMCAMLFAAGAFAQVDVTFQVDMAGYLGAGGTVPVNGTNVKIAGNFTTNGSLVVPDWTPPSSPGFTNVSGDVYSTTVTFPATSIGSVLQFKFLLTTNTWGNCSDFNADTQECFDATSGTCAPNSPDFNRELVIPALNSTVCFDWNTCNVCAGLGIKQNTVNSTNLVASPNPATNNTVINYILTAGQNVQVIVYNSLGEQITVLANEAQTVGAHKIDWNTSLLDKGLYTVVVKTGQGLKSTRVAVQ